jgi:hypothetical protein
VGREFLAQKIQKRAEGDGGCVKNGFWVKKVGENLFLCRETKGIIK